MGMYERYIIINYVNYILVEPFTVYHLTLLLELYLMLAAEVALLQRCDGCRSTLVSARVSLVSTRIITL